MKPLYLTISLLFFHTFIFGQQVSRSILTTAGDFSKNEKGISLDWTMGDVFGQTIQSTHHLTEGFQQGNLTPTQQSEAVQNTNSFRLDNSNSATQEKISVKIIAYPNPTVDQLSLKFETSASQLVMVYVTTLNGKKILQQKVQMVDGEKIEVEKINELSAGTYFIQVVKNGKIIDTQQFIKVAL